MQNLHSLRVPDVAQRIKNVTFMRLRVQSPALLHGLRIWHCSKLWQRSKMKLRYPALLLLLRLWLWLWCRLAAAAPIGPLDWELPGATDVALKKEKQTKPPNFHTLTLPDLGPPQAQRPHGAVIQHTVADRGCLQLDFFGCV